MPQLSPSLGGDPGDSRMNKKQLEQYNDLRREGVELQKHNQIRGNGGSETARHLVAKALAFHAATQDGWRVSSEVSVGQGEVDLVLFKDRETRVWAVEVETSPSADVRNDKLNRYVKQQDGIDDMVLINVTQMPENIVDAYHFVRRQIP